MAKEWTVTLHSNGLKKSITVKKLTPLYLIEEGGNTYCYGLREVNEKAKTATARIAEEN